MKKQDLEKEIDKIMEEVSNLTNGLFASDELSKYKSYLLDLKLHILERNYDNIISEIQKINEKENNKYDRINNFILLITILAFVFAFVSPYIFLVLIYISMYGCRRMDVISEDRKKELKNFASKVKDSKDIFECSYSLIKSKSNIVVSDKKVLSEEEVKNIDLANKYIDMVLNGEAIPEISPEVQNVVISLLQSDLNTQENDLEKLLIMASEKTINEVVALDDFSLKRTNGCNL